MCLRAVRLSVSTLPKTGRQTESDKQLERSAYTLAPNDTPPLPLNSVNSVNLFSRRSAMITGPLRACANQSLIQTSAQVVLLTPDLMIRIAPAGNQACKQKAVEQQRIKNSAPAGETDPYLLYWFHISECKTGGSCSGFTPARVNLKTTSCWQLVRLIEKDLEKI